MSQIYQAYPHQPIWIMALAVGFWPIENVTENMSHIGECLLIPTCSVDSYCLVDPDVSSIIQSTWWVATQKHQGRIESFLHTGIYYRYQSKKHYESNWYSKYLKMIQHAPWTTPFFPHNEMNSVQNPSFIPLNPGWQGIIYWILK